MSDTKVDIKKESKLTTIRTKESVGAGCCYGDTIVNTSIPTELSMDFSSILDKPFFVKTITWSDADIENTELTRIKIPQDIFDSNKLASIPFKSACKYRTNMCASIQVSGTPMHQGMICAAALPAGIDSITNINQILSAPRIFLFANESTPGDLEIPFYANTKYLDCPTLDDSGNLESLPYIPLAYNYADLVFLVVQPLAMSAGASTSLTISINISFMNSEFYAPKPQVSWQAAPVLKSERMKNIEIEKIEKVSKLSTIFEAESDLNLEQQIDSDFARHRGLFKKIAKKLLGKILPRAMLCVIGINSISENCEWIAQSDITSMWSSIPTRIFDGIANGARKISGDVIDAARATVRAYTGFHNPNDPAINTRMIRTDINFHNNIDQHNLFEKLDPYAQYDRVTRYPVYETLVDEMDTKNILCKLGHIGKFKVDTSTPDKTLLMAQPISPMLEIDSVSSIFYTSMRTLYECSRYWRGSLKLHLQFVGTNFHYLKLLAVRYYDVNRRVCMSYPHFDDVKNLPNDTVEFSAGGQIQTLELPFCSTIDQLPCTKDLKLNAIQHGMIYVYLAQPLVANGTVPTEVSVNAYISAGDDFQFYGYAQDPIELRVKAPGSTSFVIDEIEHLVEKIKNTNPNDLAPHYRDRLIQLNKADSSNPSKLKAQYLLLARQLWNGESETTVNVSDQSAMLNEGNKNEDSKLHSVDFVPITNVRDYLRRMVPYEILEFTPTTANTRKVIDIKRLLMGYGVTAYDKAQQPSVVSIRNLFYGMNAGVKIRIRTLGSFGMQVKYIPPDWEAAATESQFSTRANLTSLLPAGSAYYAPIFNKEKFDPEDVPGSTVWQDMPVVRNALVGTDATFKESICEFVIPYYSYLRFVGDSEQWRGITPVTSASNMGELWINFNSLAHDSIYDPVHAVIEVGYTDESRMGFQVYNPEKRIPEAEPGTGKRLSYYTDSVFPMQVTSAGIADAAYYFRN